MTNKPDELQRAVDFVMKMEAQEARAALTTGEGEMSNIVSTVEDLFRLQVAHGMEKSMSLKDPGGWPDYGEVTQHIDRMDNSEFLFAISMAIEDRLAPDAGERG